MTTCIKHEYINPEPDARCPMCVARGGLDERDSHGDLTDWALACDALADHGCDCGTDEPRTCLACVCQRAMMSERETVAALTAENARLRGKVAGLCLSVGDWRARWQESDEEARALTADLARVETERAGLQRVARELAGTVSVLEIERDNLKSLSETTLRAAKAINETCTADLARVTAERDAHETAIANLHADKTAMVDVAMRKLAEAIAACAPPASGGTGGQK